MPAPVPAATPPTRPGGPLPIRLPAILVVLLLGAATLGLPHAAAQTDPPCPSLLVAGARAPPRVGMAGAMTTDASAGDLSRGADSAIFYAPTTPTIPTLAHGRRVQVVLTLEIESHDALNVTWAFSKFTGSEVLDSRLATCAAIPNATGSYTVPPAASVRHFTILVTYIFEGHFPILHLHLTIEGTGTAAWTLTTIPLAEPCISLLNPNCVYDELETEPPTILVIR